MPWTIEVTEEFESWWDGLSDDEHVSIDGMIRVLEERGASLGLPYSREVLGSHYKPLRQLLVTHGGHDICVLYIPDESRAALVLLTGGVAHSDDEPCHLDDIATADRIYGRYIERGRTR